jgi:Membrane bound beta barrel domain (DUF5777)
VKRTLPLLALLSGIPFAQDMDSLLAQSAPAGPVQATFKSIRVVESHSVETSGKGVLNFVVSHRFGSFGNGPDGGFGLDMANTRLGLDYGFTDRLDVGFERSNNEGKPVDVWGKFRLLRQSPDNAMPVSVTWLSAGYLNTQDPEGVGSLPFSDKLSSVHQLIVARKFSEKLSLQVSPTLVQRSLVEYNDESSLSAGVGVAGRYKLNSRQALSLDVTQMVTGLHSYDSPSIGLGWDIETGGHVFQLNLVNSGWLSEDRAYTRGAQSPANFSTWSLGFHITRAFDFGG